jgi:hypothetical protein
LAELPNGGRSQTQEGRSQGCAPTINLCEFNTWGGSINEYEKYQNQADPGDCRADFVVIVCFGFGKLLECKQDDNA